MKMAGEIKNRMAKEGVKVGGASGTIRPGEGRSVGPAEAEVAAVRCRAVLDVFLDLLTGGCSR